ncbi:MAG TPA: hypothetical protein VGJ13_10595 [Pseudonocardiaceae bacterium]|jgi:hypothetical protein
MAASRAAQRSAASTGNDTAEPGQQQTHHRRTATVNLPFVTAEFRAPEIHLPSIPVRAPHRSDVTSAMSAVRSRLPSPEQAAYYAGLGLLGVLEIIEWPVVLAIGVGTAITQHGGGQRAATERAATERPGSKRAGKESPG